MLSLGKVTTMEMNTRRSISRLLVLELSTSMSIVVSLSTELVSTSISLFHEYQDSGEGDDGDTVCCYYESAFWLTTIALL